MYDDTECGGILTGDSSGYVNDSLISEEKRELVAKHNLQLDCMWVIQVEVGWMVRILTKFNIISFMTSSTYTYELFTDPITVSILQARQTKRLRE